MNVAHYNLWFGPHRTNCDPRSRRWACFWGASPRAKQRASSCCRTTCLVCSLDGIKRLSIVSSPMNPQHNPLDRPTRGTRAGQPLPLQPMQIAAQSHAAVAPARGSGSGCAARDANIRRHSYGTLDEQPAIPDTNSKPGKVQERVLTCEPYSAFGAWSSLTENS